MLLLFFDNCPSPGGLGEPNRLPGALPEPLAKGLFTRKRDSEALGGVTWPFVTASFCSRCHPTACRPLGKPKVDLGGLQAPKSMIFECVFWLLPFARSAERFGCFRSCVLLLRQLRPVLKGVLRTTASTPGAPWQDRGLKIDRRLNASSGQLTQELLNPSPSLSEFACSSFSIPCFLLQQLRTVPQGVLRKTSLHSRRALAGPGPQNSSQT